MNEKEELDAAYAEYQRRCKDRDEIRAALRSADHDIDVAVQRMISAAERLRVVESA